MDEEVRQWELDLVRSFQEIMASTPHPADDPIEFERLVADIARRVKAKQTAQRNPAPVLPELPVCDAVAAVFSSRVSRRKRD